MAKGKGFRNPNGYGSVVTLSGNRRKPYEVRVNTKIDERGYPKYDVLGRFEERKEALIALAKYNESPYNVSSQKLTFEDVYNRYFERKFVHSKKQYSRSTQDCTRAAFRKCNMLHKKTFKNIKSIDLQDVLDDYSLSHAMMEHIKNLFNQMYAYALEFDIVDKDWSSFVKITKDDDDKHGIPFSKEELSVLWDNVDKVPYVDTILIYIYSGWRVNELIKMPVENIDLENKTFQGGLKNKYSKNRIVPIHSKIYPFVKKYKELGKPFLFCFDDRLIKVSTSYYPYFKQALISCGITKHTPHDCRHTFASLLNNANANPVAIKRLLGHASNDITEDVYTHKDIDDLRKNIERI